MNFTLENNKYTSLRVHREHFKWIGKLILNLYTLIHNAIKLTQIALDFHLCWVELIFLPVNEFRVALVYVSSHSDSLKRMKFRLFINLYMYFSGPKL